jgi:hypothetical protein
VAITPTPNPPPSPIPKVTTRPLPDLPKGAVTAAAAVERVNKVAIVCGVVVSANYAKGTTGRPTFLDLDEPYPDPVFTVVIWPEDRPAFARAPEKALIDEPVCIQGRVEMYQGVPQITSVGGDVMSPDDFVPWEADELDCVKRGRRMGKGCETYLDVVIEARRSQDDMYQDIYNDLVDDGLMDP